MYRVYQANLDLDNCVLLTKDWTDASKLAKAMNNSIVTYDNGEAETFLTANFVSEAHSLPFIAFA